jgi:hypothetical protein
VITSWRSWRSIFRPRDPPKRLELFFEHQQGCRFGKGFLFAVQLTLQRLVELGQALYLFALGLVGGGRFALDKRPFPASDLLRVKPLAPAVFTQFYLAQRGGLDDDGQLVLIAQLATRSARTGWGLLFVTILAPPGVKSVLGNPRLPHEVGHTDVLRR